MTNYLNKKNDEQRFINNLATLLGTGLWFFLNPALVMWGWQAIAYECNLPDNFGYWQIFCICHGAQWLLSFVFRSRK